MEQIQLDVQLRKSFGTSQAQKVRRANGIPAVVYGAGQDTAPVQADRKIFERITRQHQGENVIFHLNVMDGDKKLSDYPAIVCATQIHPVHEHVVHIDFHRIDLTKEIHVKVSVVTRGEAIGVKRDSGTLEHHLWELEVICLPSNIPHHIEVDITNLAIHDSIHVKDITFPSGVRCAHDPESSVVSVAGSTKEITPDEQATAPAEVEVIKEKKKDEEAPKAGEAAKKPEEKKK